MVVNKQNIVWRNPQFRDQMSTFYDVTGNNAERIKTLGQAQKRFSSPNNGIERIIKDIERSTVVAPGLPSHISAVEGDISRQTPSYIIGGLYLNPDTTRVSTKALLAREEEEMKELIRVVKDSDEYQQHIRTADMLEPNLFRVSLYSKGGRESKVNRDITTIKNMAYRVVGYNLS